MTYLLDTNILLFLTYEPERLTIPVRRVLRDFNHRFCYSVASLWEIVIKAGLKKPGFTVDPPMLRQGLLREGLEELSVSCEHALAVADLPGTLHKDPFDKLIIAVARHTGSTLITADGQIAKRINGYISVLPNR